MSPCGLPIFSHWPFQRISLPIAQAASSMTGSAVPARDRHEAAQIARHADLMHTQDGARARRDGRFDQRRVDIEGRGIDIDEDRHRAAVADGVGGRDEGVADRDDLVAWLDSRRRAAPDAAPSCSWRRRTACGAPTSRRTPARTPRPPGPA